jgi:hypothetical protein
MTGSNTPIRTPRRQGHHGLLLAHLPTDDIDRIILGDQPLLEGRPLTTPAVTALRRRAAIRKVAHLPSLLVVAISALVVLDLSASGSDPFGSWPLEATISVSFGWVAAITYFATFRNAKDKAFRRCAVVPISTLRPELPRLLADNPKAIEQLTRALHGQRILDGDKLNYAEADKQLGKLAAALR